MLIYPSTVMPLRRERSIALSDTSSMLPLSFIFLCPNEISLFFSLGLLPSIRRQFLTIEYIFMEQIIQETNQKKTQIACFSSLQSEPGHCDVGLAFSQQIFQN